ncbi:MAG: hypothetical protein B6245_10630 [Desulfobacteraceae bacterium 4572_88]|nr:MAG: hypothetical protein B6245_10630 [Desulfobacteraceae bacterium 4572_88]RLC15713.1 MAG: type VI secretion system baseplate subunit TssE [Deltaproteobacteria bacterium]
MPEQRLLERLMKLPNPPAEVRGAGAGPEGLISSVTGHLRRILNTRQGTALTDPEYGLPDFSELPGHFASPETEALQETICKVVEKYEPRLKDVAASFEYNTQDHLAIRFSLSGTIVHEQERIPLHLLTRMVGGKWEVRSGSRA